ncbi:hypothetical protein CA850_08815 [Micromonospora echinospora]|uniref:Uncharacterized protein n=1 Tax=Micromonospora echinospora TaxID=1877 RepID=A0A1C4XFL0_MICEC|nr:hypothetical protein [Micromonospora echinospora]OZV82378.1 hypothetical protein CA850_08815 [Micromonospora echinospora]SCF07137.1 hypothetical protein GA0070618_3001 [Micromonospora echinospora]
MSAERRRELRGKYLKLGTGELAAAASFAVVAIALVMPRLAGSDDSMALWSALVPLLVVLVQAGIYWLAARSWVERAPMPAAIAAAYRVFRIVDAVLLGVGLAGILLWWPERIGTALLVVAVWVFGVVEYLNYFVVRLAYPLARWLTTVGQWRPPRLVQDIRTSAPGPGWQGRSEPD